MGIGISSRELAEAGPSSQFVVNCASQASRAHLLVHLMLVSKHSIRDHVVIEWCVPLGVFQGHQYCQA